MAIVELWIEGEIGHKEMRQRYIDLLARSAGRRRMAVNSPLLQNDTDAAGQSSAVDMGVAMIPSMPDEE
jgi:hypothetical protein